MISALNEQLRRIVITGTIREDSAAQFLEQITALECMDISKPISIYINTYGGSVDAALCMYDAMKSCCCSIVTVGIGKVMSAGVLLLAAGDKGNRFITENTRVMIHEISGIAIGAVSDMENSITETKRMQDVYIDILAKETNTSKTKLLKDMMEETYMPAQDAVKYGIVDKIVPTRSCSRKPTTTKKQRKPSSKKTTKKKTSKKTGSK